MLFKEIKPHLLNGEKIRRKEWQKGFFLVLEKENNAKKINFYAFLARRYQHDISIILSDDWIVVGDEKETLIPWEEALDKLRAGFKIKLPTWKDQYIQYLDNEFLLFALEKMQETPEARCFMANDWEVMD